MKLFTVEEYVCEALKYQGYPYEKYRGFETGIGPDTFNCSGLFYYLNTLFSIADPAIRHANEFFDKFGIFIHPRAVRRGDFVFFSRHGRFPTHMGLMVSENRFIHAQSKTGVHISDLVLKDIPGGENQIYFVNPIGFKRFAFSGGRFQKFI